MCSNTSILMQQLFSMACVYSGISIQDSALRIGKSTFMHVKMVKDV